MNNQEAIKQLIESNKTLIYTNEKLTQNNIEYFELLKGQTEREKKMLICFGKIYKLFKSKTVKTWEEESLSTELFEIVSYKEEDKK